MALIPYDYAPTVMHKASRGLPPGFPNPFGPSAGLTPRSAAAKIRYYGNTSPPTGYVPAPPPSGPSAGADPNWTALINSLIGGLQAPAGMVDPLTGIPLAQRAIIQYGQVPGGVGGLSNLGPAFDGGTAGLAAANTASGISVVARLAQQDADRRRQIVNSLAGHGILESGELGYQNQREQTAYAQAQADSLSKLLDYLSGINSGIGGFLGWQDMMNALRTPPAGPAGPTPSGPTAWPNPFVQPQPGIGPYPDWARPHGRSTARGEYY